MKAIILILIGQFLSCPGEKYCRICKDINNEPECAECENSFYDSKDNKCKTDI